MAESTHADLERFHYQAVRENSLYVLEGMMDVERERQAMNTPQIPDTSDLEDRIANLEAISAQTGGIPWQYQNSLTKLQGQVTFLQNKLNAALERGKQKAKQQVAKKQAEKPTYKGLNA